MAEGEKTARPWQTIADELSREHNSDRVTALAQELDQALAVDEQKPKQKTLQTTSSTTLK